MKGLGLNKLSIDFKNRGYARVGVKGNPNYRGYSWPLRKK